MVQKENWEEICGDLHAVRIIGQTGGFPKSSKENLKRSLQCVLQKSKDFATEGENWFYEFHVTFWQFHSLEESPPKKRRLDSCSSGKVITEEKMQIEEIGSKEVITENAEDEPKEEAKIDNEPKEIEKKASTSSAPPAPTSTILSSRSDLIKDIESHIEIIYECLDELNESAVNTGGSSKNASGDQINSSEKSAPNIEEMSEEAKKDDGETSAGLEESKNE